MDNKKIKLPFGIPGHNLTTIEREVPFDEPQPWPVNKDLKVVGKPELRVDAIDKVTGNAKFTSDIILPGMLVGRILRSDFPKAKILSIDTTNAELLTGVYSVHVFQNEIKGKLSYPDINFAGQPIAGVAARTKDIAEEALKLIEVEYQYKPFVSDIDTAMQKDAPAVYLEDVDEEETDGGGGSESGLKSRGNIRGPSEHSFYGGPKGDIAAGFAMADVVVNNTYRTQVQTHCPMETHGVVVDYQNDGVTIYASTQSTRSVRNEFAEIFGLSRSKVRVISEFTGGGFGSKHRLGAFGAMAGYLSKKSGRPVKMMLDRREEHIAAGNRPNSIQHLKVGAKKDGTLTSVELESYGTAGVGLGSGVGHITQAMYPCPNFAMKQYDVFTNAGPGAAFRAPGNVQGAFAIEQAMDELAEKLNIDPFKLRDLTDKSKIRKYERTKVLEKIDWNARKKAGSDSGPVKRGIGFAQGHWPRFVDMNSTAEVKVFRDGTVQVRSAVQDIGTGTKTVLAQVVAEELGLRTEDVTVLIGDTLFPDGPSSGGSIATGAITPAARNAAYKMKNELFKTVSSSMEISLSDIELAEGKFIQKSNPSNSISFKDALRRMRTEQIMTSASRSDDYGGFMMGTIAHEELGSVQFADVSVDTETGFVKVNRIVACHSCARPLNTKQIESQINGGVIMGLAYALYEDRVMDHGTGHQMNANLDQYKLPFSFEIPEIDIELIEDYPGRSSTDAYGIGEPANVATAAAIANAVYNAIGVRILELPITPARILKALNKP
jgi:xanthine dehydrogenase YagR molybdenum-binding subunit